MSVRYLTIDELLRINELLMGEMNLRDRGLLEAAIARPQASAFSEDAYPTLLEKAAALLHSLLLNHPFVDGNKRTGTVGLARGIDLHP
jgi:death-on-curing protein